MQQRHLQQYYLHLNQLKLQLSVYFHHNHRRIIPYSGITAFLWGRGWVRGRRIKPVHNILQISSIINFKLTNYNV